MAKEVLLLLKEGGPPAHKCPDWVAMTSDKRKREAATAYVQPGPTERGRWDPPSSQFGMVLLLLSSFLLPILS